jgi:hypothetical protein
LGLSALNSLLCLVGIEKLQPLVIAFTTARRWWHGRLTQTGRRLFTFHFSRRIADAQASGVISVAFLYFDLVARPGVSLCADARTSILPSGSTPSILIAPE